MLLDFRNDRRPDDFDVLHHPFEGHATKIDLSEEALMAVFLVLIEDLVDDLLRAANVDECGMVLGLVVGGQWRALEPVIIRVVVFTAGGFIGIGQQNMVLIDPLRLRRNSGL